MRNFLLLVALLAFLPAPVVAQNIGQAPSNKQPFQDKEELHYSIHYTSAMIRAAVADATLSVRKINTKDSIQYQFKGYGKTRPFFNWFYKLEDTYISTVDATTLKPHKVVNTMREGGYMYDQEFNFDWQKKVVNTLGHNIKRDRKYYKTMPLMQNSFDGLSLFYNLRSMDMTKLEKGQQIKLDLVLEDTIRSIKLRFIKRENLEVEELGTFKTLRFDCQFATSTEEAFADGDEFSLWITDDANKIPVYVKSPIKVGSLTVTLTSWKGLRAPVYVVYEE